jgi:probable phosphoglycerate mutase
MRKRRSYAKELGRTPRHTLSWKLPWLATCLLCVSFLLTLGRPVSGQSAATLRIYLARHGETDWNAERRLQGGIDTTLNTTGRQQAVKLGERLKGIRLDAIYSSTLRRSRETAEIMRGQVPLTSLPGLNERRLGKFEGLRLGGSDPVLAAEYGRRSRDADDMLDGGESWNKFSERVRAAIGSIRREHPSGAILIVGHSGTNQMILRELLGLTLEQAISIRQANDEVYLIELSAGNPTRLWKLIFATNHGDL